MEQFTRIIEIIGEDGISKLQNANVIVFGVGGVGGFAVEALVRSGIGSITVVDNDKIDITNLNRQIIATTETIGETKVGVIGKRIKSINPKIDLIEYQKLLTPENVREFELEKYDYIVDAIDTVSAKLALIAEAKKLGVKIISSLGTGNKKDITLLREGDIYETTICPLAKVIRKNLRKMGIDSLKVVYSIEEPVKTGKRTPASMIMVPGAAGLMIAKIVIEDLIE